MKRRDWIKKNLLFTCATVLTPLLDLQAGKKRRKVLFVGDSITSHGGFIKYLNLKLKVNGLDGRYELINGGLSGETITGLTEPSHPGPRPYLFDRLEIMLDQYQPLVAFFCYGINCGIYQPMDAAKLVKYKSGLDRILSVCAAQKIKPVLMTPTPLALKAKLKQQLRQNPPSEWSWREPYPAYSEEVVKVFAEVVKDCASKQVQAIDLYTPLLRQKARAYGSDPIHPNAEGHQIIATTIWDQYKF
ncbi:MAG: GDSL-type esterase/lipase family protein [Bacteroidota bacterium]